MSRLKWTLNVFDVITTMPPGLKKYKALNWGTSIKFANLHLPVPGSYPSIKLIFSLYSSSGKSSICMRNFKTKWKANFEWVSNGNFMHSNYKGVKLIFDLPWLWLFDSLADIWPLTWKLSAEVPSAQSSSACSPWGWTASASSSWAGRIGLEWSAGFRSAPMLSC